MSMSIDKKSLQLLALKLAKDIKTSDDLSALSAKLTKLMVEAALNAELEEHLGYSPYESKGRNSGNSRNGTTPKRLKGSHGEV